jgi:hypothetical protein
VGNYHCRADLRNRSAQLGSRAASRNPRALAARSCRGHVLARSALHGRPLGRVPFRTSPQRGKFVSVTGTYYARPLRGRIQFEWRKHFKSSDRRVHLCAQSPRASPEGRRRKRSWSVGSAGQAECRADESHWTGGLRFARDGALGGGAAQARRPYRLQAGPRARPAQLSAAQARREDAGGQGGVERFSADPAYSLARVRADRPRARRGARLRPRPGRRRVPGARHRPPALRPQRGGGARAARGCRRHAGLRRLRGQRPVAEAAHPPGAEGPGSRPQPDPSHARRGAEVPVALFQHGGLPLSRMGGTRPPFPPAPIPPGPRRHGRSRPCGRRWDRGRYRHRVDAGTGRLHPARARQVRRVRIRPGGIRVGSRRRPRGPPLPGGSGHGLGR